ncbi:hypothetical protein K504DRAFT_463808 [Pleomassaria siparia CBS 279.74]|uniref:GRF-type domain-containing protein n=1 Tax=Pleomassaria siparia CBS 279.74 TaxID=1314801 RepID=A0A6G1JSC7_9PLEO|nr:hypothetical protein K504DRAFT_463808 [Pleomassaria siparia CBS 279.74]
MDAFVFRKRRRTSHSRHVQMSKQSSPKLAHDVPTLGDGDGDGDGDDTDLKLAYLGPRAIIGSLSLGVTREFRIRKIVAEDAEHGKADDSLADAQGQISIFLPHNSLLVMHADMQEEWKHSIAPAQTVVPHPLAKNKRINITYRFYKSNLHPRHTPKCKCGVPMALRCVMKKKESRGKYIWMCHVNHVPGEKGCSLMSWAEFDDDGEPPWAAKLKEAGRGRGGRTDETDCSDLCDEVTRVPEGRGLA